jgi:hypothetical protein
MAKLIYAAITFLDGQVADEQGVSSGLNGMRTCRRSSTT